jgi:hypothetical protein
MENGILKHVIIAETRDFGKIACLKFVIAQNKERCYNKSNLIFGGILWNS